VNDLISLFVHMKIFIWVVRKLAWFAVELLTVEVCFMEVYTRSVVLKVRQWKCGNGSVAVEM
jgi:hypothetical protein